MAGVEEPNFEIMPTPLAFGFCGLMKPVLWLLWSDETCTLCCFVKVVSV